MITRRNLRQAFRAAPHGRHTAAADAAALHDIDAALASCGVTWRHFPPTGAPVQMKESNQ